MNTFSRFNRASPDENQHIFDHILRQVRDPGTVSSRTEWLDGERGLEPVTVIERRGITVFKRIFHPGKAEKLTGVDIAIEKVREDRLGATTVQVKRNRGENFFVFTERDLEQLDMFTRSFSSAYYLMIDETMKPPNECFLNVWEVRNLVGRRRDRSVRIGNFDVRRFCRGTDLFYHEFYTCRRGSCVREPDYSSEVLGYVD